MATHLLQQLFDLCLLSLLLSLVWVGFQSIKVSLTGTCVKQMYLSTCCDQMVFRETD